MASGDLRNVIQTVNELPDDYEGSLTVVVNDRNSTIVSRNLLILAIMAEVPDEVTSYPLVSTVAHNFF
jgi:hypothetical protein